eukprot:1298371-Rhodomonas_salina.4
MSEKEQRKVPIAPTLLVPYAMSGTDIAFAGRLMRYPVRSGSLRRRSTDLRNIQSGPAYAMSGTM